ncbi:MAG TPA: zf-HC2 domain-containing protein [Terriglobales bacterium]|nr:zf-HC2 domain-containing protein [Terriglobales bacterium]
MSELPHIVRQRLAVSSGDHPDADLLTAFAERQLAGPERERVLTHLGTCAACREVVALAAPETIVTQPVLTPARAGSWWSIRSYQYGALAAAFVIAAAGLVLLRPDRGPELRKVAQVASAPQTAPSTARSDAPANAAAEMQREPAAAAVRSEERTRVAAGGAGEGALAKKSFTISSPSAQPPKGLDALAATRQPADAAESKSVLADKADRQAAPSSSADIYAYSAPAPAPAPASLQKAQPAQPASGAQAAPQTLNAAAKRAPATVNASTETVEVATEASGASVASSKINPPAESVVDPSASTLMLQQKAKTLTADKDEQAKQAALMRDARYNTRAGTWRINNGRLQKLDPSRNAFDDVTVSGASRLSVVASLGDEVWVGGTDGALHYSNDLGAHWIPVSTGGWSKEATFTGITPTALRSVEVHLSNGERWRSADAGASWSRYQ